MPLNFRVAVAGLLTATLLTGPVTVAYATDDSTVPTSTADAGYASVEAAWAGIEEAKAGIEEAKAAVTDAKRVVLAATASLTEERLVNSALRTALAEAENTARERDEDVGQIARGMYIYGTVPGQGMDLVAVPAGVDLSEVASTQAYFASSSDYLIAQAADARSQESLAQAQLQASDARIQEREADVEAAEADVDAAEAAVEAARQELAATREAVELYLASLPTATVTANSCSNPTQDQVAATIYAQAIGLGLGEVAALVGIGVGLGETNLSNDTDGDCWGGSCANGRTSSRGVFQQFYSWPPAGTAWSGQDAPTGGTGVRFDQFNAANAWGPDGWAQSDPRMNVGLAANMFFLGPDYGPSAGLEDDALFQSLRDADPVELSSGQMVQIALQVQQFPESHAASYEQNMTRAMGYYLRIKAGKIPLPDFQPPLEGMAKSATTDITKAALADVTYAQHPIDVTDGLPNDGLLIVGDSLATGIVSESQVLPRSAFGGTVTSRTEVGIGSMAAFRKWGQDIKNGPSRVLVSLGSNDGINGSATLAEAVKSVMKAAGEDREVFWYTMHYDPVLPLNLVLRAAEEKYPNLTLVDVTRLLSPTGGYTTAADNYLHPGPTGYAAMWDTANTVISEGATTSWMCAASAGNPLADGALAWAQAQFGKPYGTNPPNTYDCSKLTGGAYHHAWLAAGKPAEYAYLGAYPFLDTTALSYDQYRSGRFEFVPLAEAQPGDFIFFNGDLGESAGNPIDHVALILDPDTMMTAEAGDPVGSYSYASRSLGSTPGMGMAGFPKPDGTPTLYGDPGWQPVAGRLLPLR